MMTPFEKAFFLQTGRALLDDLASLITSTLFFGAFSIIFIASLVLFRRRGLNSARVWAPLCLSTISYLLASLWWITFIVSIVIWVNLSLVDSVTGTATIDKARLLFINTRLIQIQTIENWVPRILPIITDGVVIWRAWVLYESDKLRWLMALPIVLLFGTFVTSAIYLGLTANPAIILEAEIGNDYSIVYLLISTLLLSLATNLTTTILIAYKLISHKKVMKSLGIRLKSSLGQRVMLLLIETGGLYCVLQLVNTLTESLPAFQGSGLRVAGRVFFAAYIQISAMYPAIVIVLVASQKSLAETYQFKSTSALTQSGTPGSATYKKEKGLSDDLVVTVGHLSFADTPSIVSTAEGAGHHHYYAYNHGSAV